ncbi:MAG: protein phosphatase 2C domain-containing protein [Pseudomonadota bacterium]
MDVDLRFDWRSAGVTHTGNVRQVNEDSICQRPEVGLWAVADGMGGHRLGDIASKAATDALSFVPYPTDLSQFIASVQSVLQTVNRDLFEQSQAETMGCTVLVLLAFKSECACLWVGDSRAYRLRGDVLYSMTRDHSYVEELVQMGHVSVQEAQNHPQSHVLTRALGASANLEVEVVRHELTHGDRYLLCSDGLYRELTELQLYHHLQRGDVQSQVDQMMAHTLSGPAVDNVSAIVVDFRREVSLDQDRCNKEL